MGLILLPWLAVFAGVFVTTLLVLKGRPDWQRQVARCIPYLFIIGAIGYGYVAARMPHERALELVPSLTVIATSLALGIRGLVRQKKSPVPAPAGDKVGAGAPAVAD